MAVEGLRELMAKLNGMQGNSTEALKKGIGRACARIQADAKQNCVVDTGRLRASIVTEVHIEGNTVVGTVGTNVEYAPYVEFGTGRKGDPSVEHTTKESWVYNANGRFYTSHGNEPKPFLYPAFRANRDKIENDITDSVVSEIIKRGG